MPPQDNSPIPSLESVGRMVPSGSEPYLAWAQKYLVDPFNRMSEAGAKYGEDIGRELMGGYETLRHPIDAATAAMPSPYGPKPIMQTPVERGIQEHPSVEGALEGTGGAIGGMAADPRNYPLMAGPGLARPLKALFTGQMAYGTYKSAEEMYKAHKAGLPRETARAGAQAFIQGVAGATTGLDAMYGEATPAHEGGVPRVEQVPGDSVVPTPIIPRTRNLAESRLTPKEFQATAGTARALQEMRRPENQIDFTNWKPDEIEEFKRRTAAQEVGEPVAETPKPADQQSLQAPAKAEGSGEPVSQAARSEVIRGGAADVSLRSATKVTDTRIGLSFDASRDFLTKNFTEEGDWERGLARKLFPDKAIRDAKLVKQGVNSVGRGAHGLTIDFKSEGEAQAALGEINGEAPVPQAKGPEVVSPRDNRGPAADDPERGSLSLRPLKPAPSVETAVKSNTISSALGSLFDALDEKLGVPSPEGQTARNIIRRAEGERSRWIDARHEEFERYAKEHDSDTVSDLIAFNNAGEGKPGASFLNPKDQAVAERFHDIYQNTLRPALADINPDKFQGAGIENYLGRLFKKGDSQATAESMIMQKGPFEGRKAFMKHRAYQWIDESIAAGATPITNNPIRMQTLVMNQIIKYISAHKAFDAFKDQGLVKFYRLGGNKIAESADASLGKEYPPPGWTRIDDSIFKPRYRSEDGGLVEQGNYYMHPDAAKVFNNWLKPGLRGNWMYDTARGVADTLNMSQLGFSAFHFTTTSIAGAATSDVALGIQQLAKGKPIKGLVSALKGMTIIPSTLETYQLGHAMENEYLRPGSVPWASKYANLLQDVNGGIGQGLQFDRNRALEFQKMWGQDGIMSKAKALGLKAFPAISEWTSRWLMRYYVPRIKLGIFAKLASETYETLRERGASPDEINTEIGKVWDSVDNRAGQMRYKNRFWNPVMKDISQVGVRSVGWSGGTLFELGGGMKDTARMLAGQGSLTPRAAYLMAAPITAAAVGGVMHYMMTGQVPRKPEDYFYPGPEGHKLNVPTYVGRDMAAWGRDPVNTALNKLNPLIQEFTDIAKNADFYNVEIRHTGDPLYKQAEDVGKFLYKTNQPISIQSALQEKARGDVGWEAFVRGQLGFTPAPAWVGRSKFENTVYDLAKRQWKAGPRTTEEFNRSRAVSQFRAQMKSGRLNKSDLTKAVQDKTITMGDLDKILAPDPASSATDRQFEALSVRQQFGALKDADPSELAHYKSLIKFDELENLPDDERDMLIREWNKMNK